MDYYNGKQKYLNSFLSSQRLAKYAEMGKLDKVKETLLEPDVDPTWNNHAALLNAGKNGYIEIVKELLSLSDGSIDNKDGLFDIIKNDQLSVLELLAPRIDMQQLNKRILYFCAAKYKVEALKILCPYIGPHPILGEVLQSIVSNAIIFNTNEKSSEMIDYLITVSDYKEVLHNMYFLRFDLKGLDYFKNRVELYDAMKQKDVLQESLCLVLESKEDLKKKRKI